jgi:AAA domain, putative AbiEii toxin, Type IV TA system
MSQQVRLPRQVRINRRGGPQYVDWVESPIDFEPSPNDFYQVRLDSPTTVLAGQNNAGKSLLLRLLRAQDTEHSAILATDRFYQLHYLPLGDNADEEFSNYYFSFFSTFESPANNDKSSVQLQSVLQALTQPQIDGISALFQRLLGFGLRVRASNEHRPLSNRYIEADGRPLQESSTGTRLLLLLLAVCSDTRVTSLYVDEPELGLSPQLQQVVATALLDAQQRKKLFPHLERVLIVTHSPLLLDRAVINNNFVVKRAGTTVEVQACETVADLHQLRFTMLGDSLDALFLPEAIVIVEGKTDHSYIDALTKRRYPDKRLTVVNATNDSEIKRTLHTLETCLGALSESPLASRLFVVLDKVHAADLPASIEARGIPHSNVIIWSENGIEYLYPDKLLQEAFRTTPDVAARLTIVDDNVSVGRHTKRKVELADFVANRLTSDTSYPTELVKKLLSPLDAALGRGEA